MNSFFTGMGIGAGLIVAIGAQNTFVLTQGIRRQHHWLVALLCSLGDMILISLGVGGVGALIAANQQLQQGARWAGAIFLFYLGVKSLLGIFQEKSLAMRNGGLESRKPVMAVILTTLGLTFLNPHVYVDTVLLLGSIGGQYRGSDRIAFAGGAITASYCWFYLLALGGSLLAPFFRRPLAWKLLDGGVWLTMWIIAGQLITA